MLERPLTQEGLRATGLLAVAVWWQNTRITDIEQRLHNLSPYMERST